LTHLRNGGIEEARGIFKSIAASAQHYKNEEALEVLSEIE
jgi:hypothetical protein